MPVQATTLESASKNRYLAAVRRYLEPGFAHILMYTAGRFNFVRQIAVAYFRVVKKHRAELVPTSPEPALCDVSVPRVVATLREDGCALGLRLRPEILAELSEFAVKSHCFGNGKRTQPFLLSQKEAAEQQFRDKFSTGRYLNCSKTCSAVEKILHDKTLLGIARGYFGTEPTMIGARCWWSFASESTVEQQVNDGQSFHYDLDDYRAICFFFYLTDVDAESGPHVCVVKSHRKKPVRWLLSMFKSRTDNDIEHVYKPESIRTITGSAGDGFAEDLFCYHKGSHPKSKDRLLLQVRYRLQDLGAVKADE
jgi:hypothetical protein